MSNLVDYKQKYLEMCQRWEDEKASHLKTIGELKGFIQTPTSVTHAPSEPATDIRYEAELDKVNQQLKEISGLHGAAQQKIKELEAANRELNNRFRNPHFWPHQFAKPFAESLEAMRDVSGSSQLDSKEMVAQTFKDWHLQIEEVVTQSFDGSVDLAHCERARRILICQWVYLRWLEVSSLD